MKKWILLLVSGVVLMAACQQKATEPEARAQEVSLPAAITVPENFNWQQAGKDERNLYFVDAQNVKQLDNGHLRYWMRVEHLKPMSLGPYKNIVNELQLNEADCGKNAAAMVYWVAQDDSGKTIASRHMNAPLPTPAGSPAGKVLSAACGR